MDKEEKNVLTLRSPIIPHKWQTLWKQYLLWPRKYAPTTSWIGVPRGMLSAEIPSSEPTTLSPGLGHSLLLPGISVLSLRESHGSKLQPPKGASTSKSKGGSHAEAWLFSLAGDFCKASSASASPYSPLWGMSAEADPSSLISPAQSSPLSLSAVVPNAACCILLPCRTCTGIKVFYLHLISQHIMSNILIKELESSRT